MWNYKALVRAVTEAENSSREAGDQESQWGSSTLSPSPKQEKTSVPAPKVRPREHVLSRLLVCAS